MTKFSTVYRVLANRIDAPILGVYVGEDEAQAQAAYLSEAHAYFCIQQGFFTGDHYETAGVIRTLASAHK